MKSAHKIRTKAIVLYFERFVKKKAQSTIQEVEMKRMHNEITMLKSGRMKKICHSFVR